MQRVRIFFENFLDFLFPTTCIVCKQGEKVICENCFTNIPTSPKDKLNILSVYEYKNKIINQLLWQLKYHHNGDVAKVFAQPISVEIKKWLENFAQDLQIIFIPTPLNKNDKRLNNHAELLANEIVKYFPNAKYLSLK
jgi:predicted amidophosphoribosyltransferase